MNVFVLCTGRCGSHTFIAACRHIRNYSSAHESRTALLGTDRLSYPANHIEADNRLSWLLGRLDKVYGDDAFYVHLTRAVEPTAASFVKRYRNGIINAYRGDGILMGLSGSADPMAVTMDYCDTVNSNIEMFLKDKSRKMQFQLECAQRDFPVFCDFIAAEVDLASALSEFDTRHHAGKRFSQSKVQRLIRALARARSRLAGRFSRASTKSA